MTFDGVRSRMEKKNDGKKTLKAVAVFRTSNTVDEGELVENKGTKRTQDAKSKSYMDLAPIVYHFQCTAPTGERMRGTNVSTCSCSVDVALTTKRVWKTRIRGLRTARREDLRRLGWTQDPVV